ncbi:MAG: hypothetical protein MI741_04140, partial [Rhodospirillales bacterium]|nr:hypothetical protein [Rhodospirillales bacterium]
KDEAIAAQVLEILEHSAEIARQAFYIGPFADQKSEPWHPNADWVQDDLIDANAAWRMIQRVPEARLDEVVAEKQLAAEQISRDRAALQNLVADRVHHRLEPLLSTLIYAESLCETLRDFLAGLVAYRRYLRAGQPGAAETVRQKILSAQTSWNHHTQRHGALPGAATAFRENGFWELTQKILGELS